MEGRPSCMRVQEGRFVFVRESGRLYCDGKNIGYFLISHFGNSSVDSFL